MKISKEDLLRVNRGFQGSLRNDSSLDFALEKQEDKKLSFSCLSLNLWLELNIIRFF